MIKKINPLMLLAIAAQTISIYYSFNFFNDINTFFGVLIVLFEITLFIFSPLIKEAKNIVIKGVMVLVVILVASFSILGVLANGYNFILESNSKQYKMIVSNEYLDYKEQLKELQKDKIELQNQLIKYPSLESTISSLKPWENKQSTINNWNNGYQKLTDEIKQSKEKIAGLKVPEKTKLIRKNIKGYNSIFKITGLKEETCIFWLTFIIAVMLQFIILSARLYKKEKLGTELGTKKLGTELGTRLENPEVDKKLGTDELQIVRDKKKLGTGLKKLGTENIIEKIESYIINNFNLEDTIKTSKLKKELNITEREWKSLDKSSIGGMKKEGTKFKRV